MSSRPTRPVRTFLDPFAGSGAVARLARARGWQVTAGDWEPFSVEINRCHLGLEAVAAARPVCRARRPRGGARRDEQPAPAARKRALHRPPLRAPRNRNGRLQARASLLHRGERPEDRCDPQPHRGAVPRRRAGRQRRRAGGGRAIGAPRGPPPRGRDAHQHLRRLQGLPQGIRRPRPGGAAPHPRPHRARAARSHRRPRARAGGPRRSGRDGPRPPGRPLLPRPAVQPAPVRQQLPPSEHDRPVGPSAGQRRDRRPTAACASRPRSAPTGRPPAPTTARARGRPRPCGRCSTPSMRASSC